MRTILLCLSVLLLSSCKNEAYLRSRVVQIYSDKGSCTGTQVHTPSGKDVILTAGHCRDLQDKDGNITAKLDNGRGIPRHVLEESHDTDLLVLEGMPGLRGVDLGDEPKVGDFLVSYSHGGAMPTYKSLGEFLQKSKMVEIIDSMYPPEGSCKDKKNAIENTWLGPACLLKIEVNVLLAPTIRPGSSGAGFFDGHGNLVAVVSASDNYFVGAVPLKEIKTFLSSY